jgi:hypothetical protein
MSLIPTDWNVVVLGYWNRAILTPSGIATRLFGLDAGTPVEVLIAIDTVLPHQIKHDGITVVAGSDRLIVQPEQCDFAKLQRAKEIADRALDKLPETPVIAAGINIKYVCQEPLETLQRVTRNEWWDEQLSDNRYEIIGRSLSRTLKFNDGQINLSVTEESDGKFVTQFNFHRGSGNVSDLRYCNASDLRSWLATPIDSIESAVRRIVCDCMQLNLEDIEHVTVTAES